MKKIIFVLFILTLPINACGIKPNSVEPPTNVEKDNFPRTYPSK